MDRVKRFINSNILKIVFLFSILFTNNYFVKAENQIIDSSGFSITTQLPKSAPEVGKGELYVEVNDNKPYFTNNDLTIADPWIEFSQLDDYGRTGPANAVLNADLIPAEKRGNVSKITPSGWQQVQYDGQYLYNRSHLLGFQLIGDGIPELNLMTGTREFNADGMVPFENFVAMVIESGLTVRYRVTPFYEGGNALASGIFMEGFSIEDNGESLSFNLYIPNRQTGIAIDYGTGLSIEGDAITQTDTGHDSYRQTETVLHYSFNRDGSFNNNQTVNHSTTTSESIVENKTATEEKSVTAQYIVNTNTGKFHYHYCSSVDQMAEHNKMPMDDYDAIINMGYVPCKRCNP